jgi:hypothetical protein
VVISPGDWIWRQLSEPLSALFEGTAHLAPTVSRLRLQALFITVLRDESSHSPSPAGFVYLRFFWMPSHFLFSSVWPYHPVAIAVLVYLQFTGKVLLPHSPVERASHQSLLEAFPSRSKLGGWRYTRLLQQPYLFTFCLGKCPSPIFWQSMPHGEAPLPLTLELRVPCPLCCVSFFSVACLLFSFVCGFFFVGQGSVCPGGSADFSQGWL